MDYYWPPLGPCSYPKPCIDPRPVQKLLCAWFAGSLLPSLELSIDISPYALKDDPQTHEHEEAGDTDLVGLGFI